MKTTLALILAAIPFSQLLADNSLKSWDGNYLPFLGTSQVNDQKEFGSLLASKVPSAHAANALAIKFTVRAYETSHVVGLYRAAITGGMGIPRFAAPGDWLWEVHIGPMDAIERILVIDAETGKEASIPNMTNH